jgi:hypothetical protein
LVRVTGLAVQSPPQIRTDIDFAGTVRLTGYELWPPQLHPSSKTEVTLYWQPLQQLGVNYTTFVHLVNADEAVIGASDHRPGGVYYPTSLWRTGDVLRDTHTFTLTTDLGRPPYSIETGLYTAEPALQHLGRPERFEVPIGNQPQGWPATASAVATRSSLR